MAKKFKSAAERIEKARQLIQEARELPVPMAGGKFNFDYLVKVKAKLREAREIVKLIPKRVGVSEEIKQAARDVLDEADQADQEIFHGS